MKEGYKLKSNNEVKILNNIKCLIEKNSPKKFDSRKNKNENSDEYSLDIKKPMFFRNASFRFVFIIVSIIVLSTISVAALTTDIFNSSIFDLGIKKAAINGKTNNDMITAESNGVKIEITGTISDKNRTVFEMKVYGINKTSNEPIMLKNMKLTDAEGNNYQFFQSGSGTQPIKDAIVNSLEFYGGPGKDTNLYLSFDSVDNVEGNWSFKIPVRYFEEKIYTTNIKYEVNDEVWIINKISIYSSKTVIEGTIEKTKDWNFTMELADDENAYNGFHCVVPDRKFPTTFKYDLEPMNISKDIILYIVNLGSNNKDDRYRAIINIPFDNLQEISPEN